MQNKSLDIFGVKYKLKVQMLDALGLCDKHAKKIYLNKELQNKAHSQELIATLVHEAVHAMCQEGGLSQAIPPELEEVLAEQVSTVMVRNFEVRLKAKK
jgi:hypothetical protein